ncbi:MAG: S8 family serine peptidase [Ignavibacteria bacterium]|nr:S8 family serine peptidase [Ignavibacteria bacterium]
MKIYLLIIFISISFFSFSYSETRLEVTTVLKEKFYDREGNILTGKGGVIGDVDSGIDVFHPMFFFADGGEFIWTDIDGNGILNIAKDGVDLNGNKKIDDKEIIRYIEIKDDTWGMLSELGANPKAYDPAFDFLYVDLNKNKKRDYGPEFGFRETDPGYGEPMFIAIDDNKNGKIEAGEKLIMLKTSKIRSVLQRDGQIRRRGVDMIYCEHDSIGHGTAVAGLIIGGHYGVQKIHGIAPDAEMVFASIRYDYTPRFVRNFPQLFAFLRDEKVNILLIEDGEWMHEFMDGSTEEEEMLNDMARNGTVIIGGAGNFTGSNMLIIDELQKGRTAYYTASCPKHSEGKINDGVFFTFLWRNTESTLNFIIESPDGEKTDILNNGSGRVTLKKYNIHYAKDMSNKGTSMFRLTCSAKDSSSVQGNWKISVTATVNTELRAYVVDVSQSWSGTSRWKNSDKISNEGNVCFPSTADSCIAVGAYVVNMGWLDEIGGLAYYSSKGYNITGKMGIDITAPGHSTFSTGKNFGWQIFSGTSSAAPHVVGAAALMLQYNPQLTHSEIRNIIITSAKKDKFTGNVPNSDWGWGKLDIENALKTLINN